MRTHLGTGKIEINEKDINYFQFLQPKETVSDFFLSFFFKEFSIGSRKIGLKVKHIELVKNESCNFEYINDTRFKFSKDIVLNFDPFESRSRLRSIH